MKLTAISIFPEYFAPLELSLIGKARSQGLVNFSSINLRDFTYDNHHTVDDTPYGGGAGMVMKPTLLEMETHFPMWVVMAVMELLRPYLAQA